MSASRQRRKRPPRLVPSARLDRLWDLGGGILLHPWLRRQDEGRALAALEPEAAPLSVLVRRWAWPMPRRWGSEGAGPGQFRYPQGLAVSSGGDIVVCDADNTRVQVFRADGTFVREWGTYGTAPGQFQDPHSASVSSADEVFITDFLNHRVQVFRLDGSFVRSWGTEGAAPGQFWNPSGVAVHGNLVLVSDYDNHRIQCFGLDGTFVRMWGSCGVALGEFRRPQGLAVSSAGEVFVCDWGNQRVKVFDLDGRYRRSWGSRHGNEFQYLDGVVVSSTGEVLVSAGTLELSHVQVFGINGAFIRCLHLPAGIKPMGMALTASGDVVICDNRNKSIYVEPAGA